MDNKSNNVQELELCPVCGHRLIIMDDEENKGKLKVFCYACGFEEGSFNDHEELTKAWGKKEKE